MSYIVKAGTPFLRYTDPMIPQVNPRGLQPQSAYTANLFYVAQEGELNAILPQPGNLTVQVLFFAADYPISISGTQGYPGVTYAADSRTLAPLANPIRDLTLPIIYAPPNLGPVGTSEVPAILPGATPVRYQEKITGATATNGVTVTGFPQTIALLGHHLYATDEGDNGPLADYAVSLSAIFSSGSVTGPAAFTDTTKLPDEFTLRVPIILYEPDFVQAYADNGFSVSYTVGVSPTITYVFDIVGLWSSDGYSPVPQVGARKSAPLKASAAPPLGQSFPFPSSK